MTTWGKQTNKPHHEFDSVVKLSKYQISWHIIEEGLSLHINEKV